MPPSDKTEVIGLPNVPMSKGLLENSQLVSATAANSGTDLIPPRTLRDYQTILGVWCRRGVWMRRLSDWFLCNFYLRIYHLTCKSALSLIRISRVDSFPLPRLIPEYLLACRHHPRQKQPISLLMSLSNNPHFWQMNGIYRHVGTIAPLSDWAKQTVLWNTLSTALELNVWAVRLFDHLIQFRLLFGDELYPHERQGFFINSPVIFRIRDWVFFSTCFPNFCMCFSSVRVTAVRRQTAPVVLNRASKPTQSIVSNVTASVIQRAEPQRTLVVPSTVTTTYEKQSRQQVVYQSAAVALSAAQIDQLQQRAVSSSVRSNPQNSCNSWLAATALLLQRPQPPPAHQQSNSTPYILSDPSKTTSTAHSGNQLTKSIPSSSPRTMNPTLTNPGTFRDLFLLITRKMSMFSCKNGFQISVNRSSDTKLKADSKPNFAIWYFWMEISLLLIGVPYKLCLYRLTSTIISGVRKYANLIVANWHILFGHEDY